MILFTQENDLVAFVYRYVYCAWSEMLKMSQACTISIPDGRSVPITYGLWVCIFNSVIYLGINTSYRIVILCN